MEQTFTQASAWGEGFPEAFSAALEFYVASGDILKIHDGRHLDEQTAAKIYTLIVENRLRI
ncbi:hypothetical protein FIBSPDRAFT_879071 [Athelia psychrophila]|uniref:Uncharacterized protein n=1 Tax=Athelia psychrophila TaxID=1759441 RepID=A0A167UE77_9AGAM|nr:hypothetical protein FIBSPDRAFT_879071 [Fibularhizoctonia sp. CBS 109695]